MAKLKSPYKEEDQIPSETIIAVGKRLKEIEDEITQITKQYCIGVVYDIFSPQIEELREDIIETLGSRQLH